MKPQFRICIDLRTTPRVFEVLVQACSVAQMLSKTNSKPIQVWDGTKTVQEYLHGKPLKVAKPKPEAKPINALGFAITTLPALTLKDAPPRPDWANRKPTSYPDARLKSRFNFVSNSKSI